MKRFWSFVGIVLVAGCGEPPDICPPWAQWPTGGEVEKGIRLYLQTGRDKYVKGK